MGPLQTYVLISSTSTESITKSVNVHLEEGWVLFGPPFGNTLGIFQAMILPKDGVAKPMYGEQGTGQHPQ